MSSFKICTLNLATDENDYLNTYNLYRDKAPNNGIEFPEAKRSDADHSFDQPFKDRYSQVQLKTSALLDGKAHVYCLQEVGSVDRNILQFLRNDNFQAIHCNIERPDTAIFLDKRRFTHIHNFSFTDSG